MKETAKDLFLDVVVKAVVVKMTIAFPFLAIPIIKQLFSMTVKKIASALYDEAAITGLFLSIDFTVNGQLNDYNEATTDLRDTLNKPEASNEEIERAKEEYRNRLRDLIRIN